MAERGATEEEVLHGDYTLLLTGDERVVLPMHITCDPRYGIAYIRFQEKRADVETVRVSDEMNVDMSPDGTLYGIELLNANEQLGRENLRSLVVVNEATGTEDAIPLAIG